MNGHSQTNQDSRQPDQIKVYLSIGSNVYPEVNFPKGVALLEKVCKIVSLSDIWETPPAHASGPNFLNAACCLLTSYESDSLKHNVLREIEKQMGRMRTTDKNAPRPIDFDIIIYNDTVIEARIWTEVFLAVPLAQLLPDLRNPQTNETLADAATSLAAKTPVKRRSDVLVSPLKKNI